MDYVLISYKFDNITITKLTIKPFVAKISHNKKIELKYYNAELAILPKLVYRRQSMLYNAGFFNNHLYLLYMGVNNSSVLEKVSLDGKIVYSYTFSNTLDKRIFINKDFIYLIYVKSSSSGKNIGCNRIYSTQIELVLLNHMLKVIKKKLIGYTSFFDEIDSQQRTIHGIELVSKNKIHITVSDDFCKPSYWDYKRAYKKIIYDISTDNISISNRINKINYINDQYYMDLKQLENDGDVIYNISDNVVKTFHLLSDVPTNTVRNICKKSCLKRPLLFYNNLLYNYRKIISVLFPSIPSTYVIKDHFTVDVDKNKKFIAVGVELKSNNYYDVVYYFYIFNTKLGIFYPLKFDHSILKDNVIKSIYAFDNKIGIITFRRKYYIIELPNSLSTEGTLPMKCEKIPHPR